MTNFKPETLLLHGGQQPDPVTGTIAVPIYRTTAYEFQVLLMRNVFSHYRNQVIFIHVL